MVNFLAKPHACMVLQWLCGMGPDLDCCVSRCNFVQALKGFFFFYGWARAFTCVNCCSISRMAWWFF